MRCIHCQRSRPACGFYPVTFMSGPAGSGQLCWDCDGWLRDGRPERETPTAEQPPTDAPLGACWMRCCRAWEEDDNAVDWGSLADGGYLHWGRAERRPRSAEAVGAS